MKSELLSTELHSNQAPTILQIYQLATQAQFKCNYVFFLNIFNVCIHCKPYAFINWINVLLNKYCLLTDFTDIFSIWFTYSLEIQGWIYSAHRSDYPVEAWQICFGHIIFCTISVMNTLGYSGVYTYEYNQHLKRYRVSTSIWDVYLLKCIHQRMKAPLRNSSEALRQKKSWKVDMAVLKLWMSIMPSVMPECTTFICSVLSSYGIYIILFTNKTYNYKYLSF